MANKIGTYTVAVLAKEHGIPFYVAAPLSTIDLGYARRRPESRSKSGNDREVTHVGAARLTPEGARIRNPAFDVTPAGSSRRSSPSMASPARRITESLAGLKRLEPAVGRT